jgi:hypothetical protein
MIASVVVISRQSSLVGQALAMMGRGPLAMDDRRLK